MNTMMIKHIQNNNNNNNNSKKKGFKNPNTQIIAVSGCNRMIETDPQQFLLF